MLLEESVEKINTVGYFGSAIVYCGVICHYEILKLECKMNKALLLTLYEVWLVERGMQTMLEGQAHHLIYAKGFYRSRPFSDKGD